MAKISARKLKSLVRDSNQTSESDEDEGAAGATDEQDQDDEGDDDEDGGEPEVTVESLAKDLEPGLSVLNEAVDAYRTGDEDQPHAGLEALEEEVDAKVVHDLEEWSEEAGKKDFRKLGDELGVDDTDAFVGFMRKVRARQEEKGTAEDHADKGGGQDEEEEQPNDGGDQEDGE